MDAALEDNEALYEIANDVYEYGINNDDTISESVITETYTETVLDMADKKDTVATHFMQDSKAFHNALLPGETENKWLQAQINELIIKMKDYDELKTFALEKEKLSKTRSRQDVDTLFGQLFEIIDYVKSNYIRTKKAESTITESFLATDLKDYEMKILLEALIYANKYGAFTKEAWNKIAEAFKNIKEYFDEAEQAEISI
jgi:hypothetical protein